MDASPAKFVQGLTRSIDANHLQEPMVAENSEAVTTAGAPHNGVDEDVAHACQSVRRTFFMTGLFDVYISGVCLAKAYLLWLQQRLFALGGWMVILPVFVVNTGLDFYIGYAIADKPFASGRVNLQKFVAWSWMTHVSSIIIYAVVRFALDTAGLESAPISLLLGITLVRAFKLRPLWCLKDAVLDDSQDCVQLRQHWPRNAKIDWKSQLLIGVVVVVLVMINSHGAVTLQHGNQPQGFLQSLHVNGTNQSSEPVMLDSGLGHVLDSTAAGCGVGVAVAPEVPGAGCVTGFLVGIFGR